MKRAKHKAPEYPRIFDLFDDPSEDIRRDASVFDGPSCFNGRVRLQRYRVTVESIDESKDVYAERLRILWRGTDNYNDRDCLKREAKALGIELAHDEFGAGVKKGA